MSNKTKIFKCIISRCVFNSDNFKVYGATPLSNQYELELNEYNNITLIGTTHELYEELEYVITAIPEKHKKYGITYKIVNAKMNQPVGELKNRLFLERILSQNQVDTILTNYPDFINMVIDGKDDNIDINKLRYINEEILDNIKSKILSNFVLIDLVDKYKGYLSIGVIKKLFDKYKSVDDVIDEINKNPYKCLYSVNGIGFKTADDIIITLTNEDVLEYDGDIKTSIDRSTSAILYLLTENENNGNTYINEKKLYNDFVSLVPECKDHFHTILENDFIYYNCTKDRIANKYVYDIEKYIGESLLEALKIDKEPLINIDKIYNDDKYDLKQLTDKQLNAVEYLINKNVFILNGFGGSGKSFTTGKAIQILDNHKQSYLLLAPTGRASQVISKYSNREAYTIHRGLGYNPSASENPDECWAYNKENKMPFNYVLVDESSMVDIFLMKRIIDAIDFNVTKLVLIGDNAQIPSVSCGNIFHDLIESEIIPMVTLDKVFRFGKGGIDTMSTNVRNSTNVIKEDKITTLGEDKSYCFVPTNKTDYLKNVKKMYKRLFENPENNVEDILILSYRKAIVKDINNEIQKIANNKNTEQDNHIKVGQITLFEDDIVIQTVNNYKAKDIDGNENIFIANGELGKILLIDSKSNSVHIQFNNNIIVYNKSQLGQLQLGYAITIHKSQGGQCKNVILVNTESDKFLLNSNLIYVGITRAEKLCVHLTNVSTLNSSVKKKENFKRDTFLQDILKDEM